LAGEEVRVNRKATFGLSFAAGVAATLLASGAVTGSTPSPWWGCCGAKPWNQGRRAIDSLRAAGSARNRSAMVVGIPPSFAGLRNPLPRTRATVARGADVYDHYCATCHGVTGLGDGQAGRALEVPPANLALLARMPISRWDPFMYWTVTEGGATLHTAMPPFKNSLSSADSWAAIAYIQARLPRIKTK
jgi:mono/diheme cytochrome c family protein